MLKAGAQGTKGCYYNKQLYVNTYMVVKSKSEASDIFLKNPILTKVVLKLKKKN